MPNVVTVTVERRVCEKCGIYAMASDNWRETGVYNYNNSYMVAVTILYNCLDAFISGTPIQDFFTTFVAPLGADYSWAYNNPEAHHRYGGVINVEKRHEVWEVMVYLS